MNEGEEGKVGADFNSLQMVGWQDETVDDDLGIEDCTPMAENQIMRTFSKKQLGKLDETSFQRLSQLDYAPSPTILSPQSKKKVAVPVSENVYEETKDEVPQAIKPIMSSETDKKIATRRPNINVSRNAGVKLDSFRLRQNSSKQRIAINVNPNVLVMPIRDPKAGIPEYQTVKMTPVKPPTQLKLITQNVTGLTDSTPIFFHNSPSLLAPGDERSDLESLEGQEI